MTRPVAESKTYQTYLRNYPEFKQFVDLMPSKQFQPLPPVTVEMFIADKINQNQDLALRGTLTPAQAVAKLEKDVKDEIARRAALGDR
jgi:ABC-type glycerol-3-phosphate transport system substrate-binding protein